MKKTVSLFLLAALLLSLLGLYGCAGRAPKLEAIYDRVVYLVEASYELNTVFYGEGLPYYDRTQPVYQTLYSDYTTEQYTKDYNIVRRDAKYRSVEEIKLAAELVYSKTLLEETVYPSVFVGLISAEPGINTQIAPARYLQGNEDLYILMEDQQSLHAPTRLVFDYASMKIVRPSNSSRVILSINAWEETTPNTILQERIILTCTDGIWYLDSLTV